MAKKIPFAVPGTGSKKGGTPLLGSLWAQPQRGGDVCGDGPRLRRVPINYPIKKGLNYNRN
ncbi:hypothetical protein MHTCC0001_23150 [Flavobacteriaceae bacterium MHTCC 0001]